MRGGNGVFIGSRRLQQTRTHKNARVATDGEEAKCTFLGDKKYYRLCLLEAKNVTMVLLLFFLYFSIVQYIRIVVRSRAAREKRASPRDLAPQGRT